MCHDDQDYIASLEEDAIEFEAELSQLRAELRMKQLQWEGVKDMLNHAEAENSRLKGALEKCIEYAHELALEDNRLIDTIRGH